jgi:chitinase
MMKRRYLLTAALCTGFALCATDAHAQRRDPFNRQNPVFAGYREYTFANASPQLKLRDVPLAFNVANESFCTMDATGNIVLPLASRLYANDQEYVDDINAFKRQGGVVQCSLGGADSNIIIDTPQKISSFVSSLNALYDKYGFNGIDIDLEGASFKLDPGDQDPANPTTPQVRNFITALRTFLDTQDAKNGGRFFLTMAPETFFVQRGLRVYGPTEFGPPAGAALPFIEAFRDRLDVLYAQLYNTPGEFGLDGVVYLGATTDFLVSQSEILLRGFNVGMTPRIFKPLRPDQVALGVLANTRSGSGFQPPSMVIQALRYITQGSSAAVGTYKLQKPEGYPDFRGLMTFSVNQDVSDGGAFSTPVGQFLSTLRSAPSAAADAN